MSKRMTCVFDFDVKDFPTNPHHAETPFGKPVVVSSDDMAATVDELESEIERLTAFVDERLQERDCDVCTGQGSNILSGQLRYDCETCNGTGKLPPTHVVVPNIRNQGYVWSEEESELMRTTYEKAYEHHGFYESLFAVVVEWVEFHRCKANHVESHKTDNVINKDPFPHLPKTKSTLME